MRSSDVGAQLQAVIVGRATDSFVRYAMSMLGNCDVGFIHCGDVYSAVGELVKNKAKNVLVIGRLEHLSKEQGRFFRKISENGFSCCCLTGRNLVHKRKQILDAIKTGAFVINEPVEIKKVVAKLSAAPVSVFDRRHGGGQEAFGQPPTKVELDALFGTGADTI